MQSAGGVDVQLLPERRRWVFKITATFGAATGTLLDSLEGIDIVISFATVHKM